MKLVECCVHAMHMYAAQWKSLHTRFNPGTHHLFTMATHDQHPEAQTIQIKIYITMQPFVVMFATCYCATILQLSLSFCLQHLYIAVEVDTIIILID